MVPRVLLLFVALACISYVNADDDVNPTAVRLVTIHPHNVSAFTEGLVFDDNTLIESTGLKGQSFIRQYRLSDLKVDFIKEEATQSVPFLHEFRFDDDIFGEGVTVLGDELFALTYKAEKMLVLSRHDFQLLGQFPLTTSTKEGWGLTTDGEFLITSDGSAELLFFDPKDDFKLHHSITVRNDGKNVTNVNELEFVEGELLANVWHENHILRINITNGDVLEQIDLSWMPNMVPNINAMGMEPSSLRYEAVMNGIAYNPVTNHVFVTGKLWDSMFEIELSYLSPY